MAAGSEVALALAAGEELATTDGMAVRVVSVPWRERFGASAPGARVYAELGFTPERVAATVRQVVRANRHRPPPSTT